jgi:hypothetical protein
VNNFISKVISDDFVWSAINTTLHAQRRVSGTGFINICCPLCVSRGESQDRKFRCGIKRNTPGVGVSCFNCGFRALWQPGELLSRSMRTFLLGIGMNERDVQHLNHKAGVYRRLYQQSPEAIAVMPETVAPRFEPKSLPGGARSFAAWAEDGCEEPDFLDAVEYLLGRGDEIARFASPYWTPNTAHGFNRRVIVPLTHEGTIVGYSARAIDPGVGQRYHMEAPSNYLFNTQAMTRQDRAHTILVEGLLDAVAIDGVGLLGARLNAQQAAWIKAQGRTPILVPDRDARGADLIEVALEQDFAVAFPALNQNHANKNWWHSDVKDVAEAVKRYGRLWTLISILKTATTNKIEIQFKRKALF